MNEERETAVTSMSETKETIINLLTSTNRPGMDGMIDELVKKEFFLSPASTKFHGCYVGGLAAHSLRVYELLDEFVCNFSPDQKVGYGQMPIKVELNNLIIAGLLHDVCKCGAYVRTKADDGWTNNRDKDKGHAKLSIKRIENFIELEKIENLMITFHMGIYGLNEFQDKPDDPNGEYPLEYPLRGDHSKDPKDMTREQKTASQKARYGKSLANTYYHNIICFWMHVADMQATAEEKVER